MDNGWGDLHLIACISSTVFQHTAHDGRGGLRIRFGVLENQGVVQIRREGTGREVDGG